MGEMGSPGPPRSRNIIISYKSHRESNNNNDNTVLNGDEENAVSQWDELPGR